MVDYIKLIEEQIQNKKHIVITGAIGSGKSTLLNKLRYKLDPTDCIPGLITWNVQKEAVYMRKVGDDEFVTIGSYNPHSLSTKNRMLPVTDSFNVYGVSLLEKFINVNSDWVTIDEIGFLESTCEPYINKLYELFEKKRVIAVVRKQDIKHINDIIHREDALVIDLDLTSSKL